MLTGRRTNRALSGLVPDTPARAIMRSKRTQSFRIGRVGFRSLKPVVQGWVVVKFAFCSPLRG